MYRGYVCVAGVNIQTMAHVRPARGGARLSTEVLKRYGGPFDMASLVDLSACEHTPSRPEVEDYLIDVSRLRFIRTFENQEFWRMLTRIARPRLSQIFGNDLTRRGPQSCGVDVGAGEASLGCLLPSGRPHLYLREDEGKPKIRIEITDEEFDLDLAVTDIRLYGDDHVAPNPVEIERVANRLSSGVGVVLSVGLTRPYPPSSPLHWLQVNNIHLEDDPAWQLG